jgi:hypothetical protein
MQATLLQEIQAEDNWGDFQTINDINQAGLSPNLIELMRPAFR